MHACMANKNHSYILATETFHAAITMHIYIQLTIEHIWWLPFMAIDVYIRTQNDYFSA